MKHYFFGPDPEPQFRRFAADPSTYPPIERKKSKLPRSVRKWLRRFYCAWLALCGEHDDNWMLDNG